MLFLRILGGLTLVLTAMAVVVLFGSLGGGRGPDSGLADGILFFGLISIAAVIGAITCIASFVMQAPDRTTKLFARIPLALISVLIAVMLLGGMII